MSETTLHRVVILCIAVLLVVMAAQLNGSARMLAEKSVQIAEPAEYTPVVIQVPTYVSREEVNIRIRTLLFSGRLEEVYRFYDQWTANREITHLLVNTAILSQIPVNLLFALVQRESSFNPRALNRNSTSSDHGLMQLNSATFASLSEEEIYDPILNVRHGAAYLVEQHGRYGNWESAVLAYNAGNADLVRTATVRHLVFILEYERAIDRAFVEAFGA